MPETVILAKKPVLEVLAQWVGIPVERLDPTYSLDDNLLRLEEKLKAEIFGQDHAINVACQALKRRFMLWDASQDEMRPIATLLFVGGSGTGKTELAHQIGQHFFGSSQHLIRLNGGNYAEEHSISKLLGSPPGYVGYGEGGQLTNALRKQNYAVILFDEVEKAHPKLVTDVLLQLSSNGTVTDGNTGTLLDATNTIVILTSNLGTSFDHGQCKEVGFMQDSEDTSDKRHRILAAVRSFLPHEMLGRIDEIVVFRELDEEAIRSIWRKEARRLEERLSVPAEVGADPVRVCIVLSDRIEMILINKARKELATQGARAIQRVFRRWVADPIAEMRAAGSIPVGMSVSVGVDYRADDTTFTYTVERMAYNTPPAG